MKGCAVCQRDKVSNRKLPGALIQPETSEGKWQVISMDIITALPITPRGNNMILTVVDFSKMVHLVACHDTADAQKTANYAVGQCVLKTWQPKENHFRQRCALE